jgi:hypothetical protein
MDAFEKRMSELCVWLTIQQTTTITKEAARVSSKEYRNKERLN